MDNTKEKDRDIPRRRGKRLRTLADVRRYLAGLINKTESQEVDAGLAGRLGYLANILKSCIIESDIEVRLKFLEDKIGRKEV